MNEFELIDRYFRRASGPGVVLGVGDDGAVLSPPPGRELVVVADTQVHGRHFPADMAAADIGWRSVAVNLSDIAAMGATPAWMTLAITLTTADEHWLNDFAAGLREIADSFGVSLVGGDTTRGAEFVVTVQIIGHVAAGKAITRSGGKPGDSVYVTGHVGDAAAGLAAWQAGVRDGPLVDRLRRPVPRVALGKRLPGIASAAIDISDGLGADLGHVLAASRCGALVDLSALPLSDAAIGFAGRDAARRHALTGGDDYELCITVPADRDAAFQAAAAASGVQVRAIGVLDDGEGLRLRDGDTVSPFTDAGYRHF